VAVYQTLLPNLTNMRDLNSLLAFETIYVTFITLLQWQWPTPIGTIVRRDLLQCSLPQSSADLNGLTPVDTQHSLAQAYVHENGDVCRHGPAVRNDMLSC